MATYHGHERRLRHAHASTGHTSHTGHGDDGWFRTALATGAQDDPSDFVKPLMTAEHQKRRCAASSKASTTSSDQSHASIAQHPKSPPASPPPSPPASPPTAHRVPASPMNDLDALAGSLAASGDTDAFVHISLHLGGGEDGVSTSWESVERLHAGRTDDDNESN